MERSFEPVLSRDNGIDDERRIWVVIFAESSANALDEGAQRRRITVQGNGSDRLG